MNLTRRPQGKDEEKFDFTGEGEAVDYISLAQARLLAMQTARESPGEYGSQYQGVSMAFEVVVAVEEEDYYTITLSFRPQGDFPGSPGQEQFFIEKEGTVAHRQVLSLPREGGGRRFPVLPVAIGVVIVGVIVAAGALFVLDGSGDGGELVAVVAATATPTPTDLPALTTELTKIPPTSVPTDSPVPTAAPTSTATPTTIPTATPRPTYTPFPTATPRPTYTPVPAPTARVVTAAPRVIAATPTRLPTPTLTLIPASMNVMAPARAIVQGKHGGFINMDQYADVRQRIVAQSSVLNMNLTPLFNNLVEFNPETPRQGRREVRLHRRR